MDNQKQTEQHKKAKKSIKRKHYDKPLSLYPLSLEEAVEVLLHTPPMKDSKKKRKRTKQKTRRKNVNPDG